MARGVMLRQLISDLRDELRRANSPAASPDDTASLRRTINHVYSVLYYTHNWSFLNTIFDPIPLAAGQRYYDMPEGLDTERITDVRLRWSGNYFVPLDRGISVEDYNAFDPNENQRASPALKWDVRFTGEREQIEIWPLPDDSGQSLRFTGVYKINQLVNDTDQCRLDNEVVTLYAAAELLPKDSPDKDAKLQLAQEMLRLLKLRSASGGDQQGRYRVGVGSSSSLEPNPRTTVRIGS